MEHIGSQGREIIRSVIGLSADNYPEMMGKCYMINTPWLFNTLWYFVKGLLAQRTIDKVAIIGTSYIPELQKRVSLENLPRYIYIYCMYCLIIVALLNDYICTALLLADSSWKYRILYLKSI
jgi:hypothetical protein